MLGEILEAEIRRMVREAVLEALPKIVRGTSEAGGVVEVILPSTPAEERVRELVREGLSNKQIALRIGCTEGTVKTHMKALMRKYGVSNRTQLALCQDGGR